MSNIDISNKKFIVHSGCSYGRLGNSLINVAGNLDSSIKSKLGNINPIDCKDDVILINVAMSSQGSDWQSDSSIYVCNELINLGVSTENIYCTVEWSEWTRTAQPLPQFMHHQLSPNDILTEDVKDNISGDVFISRLNYDIDTEDVNYIRKKLNIHEIAAYHKLAGSNLGYIDGNIYLSARHTDVNESENVFAKHWIEESQKIENSEYMDSVLRRYLNNIIRTQNFLKLKGINYNFFHMQSCLSNWYVDDNGIIKHRLTHGIYDNQPFWIDSDNKIHKNNIEIKSSSDNHFEKIWKNFNHLFNQIDLSNFWFHESSRFTRGGIDEWAIDTFKEVGYTNLEIIHRDPSNIKNLSEFINLPSFGYHPSEFLYHLIWNDICTNCDFIKVNKDYLNKIYELIEEDYNSNKLTENYITVSKKYFYDSINTINNV